MIIGCLTGSGKGVSIDGEYAYEKRGVSGGLPPDLGQEKAGRENSFSFSEGVLTDGALETFVGWKAASVGENGVDIRVDLKAGCFVDRVILRQRLDERRTPERKETETPGGQGTEVVDYVEPSGLSCVEVYAKAAEADDFRRVGRRGEKGPVPVGEEAISVSVGTEARELVVRAISFQRDIVLEGMEIWGAYTEEPRVFPVPRMLERLADGDPFRLTESTSVTIGPNASEATRFAAQVLVEKIGEVFGLSVRMEEEGELPSSGGVIVVGKSDEWACLEEMQVSVPEDAEGYCVQVEGDHAIVLARDRRGLIYGVETLLQLLQYAPEPGTVEACIVEDAPRMAFRGVHLYVPARDQLAFARRLIRYVLAPMKMNTIFMELAGAMQLDRRPEINRAWEESNRKAAAGEGPPVPHGGVCGGGTVSKQEVADLVAYARDYGFEVIPEIQSLSHVQYLTMTYPEIAEAEEEGTFPDSYCPLHPESHKIVFDMIDEVSEVFGPLRYIHMGHDEVYTMAECERCRGKSRAELYAYDVNAIHDYLKKKGLGMMVWADMLQEFRYYSGSEAIDMIPKDIVMLEFVWYFRTWADTEDVLLDKGFEVILGNCYSSHFTRFESRSAKDGVVGAQVSVWSGTNEEEIGRLGKLYDFIYSANGTWSDACQDELRWTFDRKIAQLMPGFRAGLRGACRTSLSGERDGIPLDLGACLTSPLRDETGGKGGYDLTDVPKGEVLLQGIPFRVGEGVILLEGERGRGRRFPTEANVSVAAKLSGLAFLHTCSSMGPMAESLGGREQIARYEVVYVDGSVEEIGVAYGHQVAEWDRRHGEPLTHTFHRHAGYIATYPADPFWQGKTPLGQDVTLYGLEWANPKPEKEIRALRVVAGPAETDASLIVVAITGIVTEDDS